jgi:phage terminase large subunit-like protein
MSDNAIAVSELFSTVKTQAAAKYVKDRLATLKKQGFSADESSDEFNSECALLHRVSQFDMSVYPDYSIPTHLLMYPPEHVRWDHIYDVVQVIESLRHVKGSLAGEHIKLDPFQVLIVLCMLGPEDPETGYRLVKEAVLTMSRKNAKDLALDTPIPTPSGWATMGDIQVGDYVLGSDGLPVRVTAVSEIFHGNACYDVHFSDGTVITAGEGHLWTTSHRETPTGAVERVWAACGDYQAVCTTRQLYDSLTVPRRDGSVENNHHIVMPYRRETVEITNCIPVQSVPTKCIAVDAPDSLFLAGRGGIPTHNTTLIAGIVTALMVLPKASYGMEGQELYVGASDRKQAGITFGIVNKFILQDRDLGIAGLFKIIPSSKHMTHKVTLTEFEVLSSDAYRSHGLNPAMVIFDEAGNVPAAAASEFIDVLTSGYGAQAEPLTAYMSTQAPSDVHIFSQIVDRCKRINAGEEAGPEVAGFIFETPEQLGKEKLDPHDERYWYLANPGIGTIVGWEDMRKASRDAKALPSKEAKFRNLRLNQRANPYSPFITKSAWMKCGGPLDYDLLYGQKAYLALDLSSVLDLTCLTLTFEPDENGLIAVLPFFFMPSEGLKERQDNDKVPYLMWADQGFLDTSSHKTIDQDIVAGQVEVCLENFDVQGFGCDRWRMKDTQKAMRERGLGSYADNEEFMFSIGQGFKDANMCVEALERAVAEEKLRHGDHPVLTWCVSNTVTVSDPANNRKFDKAKSYGRIDGTVTLAMSLRVRELLGQEDTGPSLFEEEQCLM